MTYPLDLQSDARRVSPVLPRVVFWLGILIVAFICGALHGKWWHFLIGILAMILVRVTTKWEAM